MNFLEKLNFLMDQYGLNKRTLSQNSHIPYTTIDNWYKRGYDAIKINTIQKLSSYFNTSTDFWIFDEITDQNYGKSPNVKISCNEIEHIKKYRALDDSSKKHIDYELDREYSRAISLQTKDDCIKKFKTHSTSIIDFDKTLNNQNLLRIIQYFYSVSAGTGQVIYDDVASERISIPDIPEYRLVAYAVKVSGRSMEPLYNDGDILLIEPTCDVNIGEIGIFNVHGKAYVKKLGETELISLNKEYSNVPLAEDAICMGRVIDKYITESDDKIAALNIGKSALETTNQIKKSSKDLLG